MTFEPIKIQAHSAPQNDRLSYSFVKDIHLDGRNLVCNSCKTAICQSTSFRDTLYFTMIFVTLPEYIKFKRRDIFDGFHLC